MSRDENFLLVISKVGSADGTPGEVGNRKNRILVFDISTSRLLAESVVGCEISNARFNPSATSNNKEFLLLGDGKIFFWRLKNNNNLQYQEITIKNPGAVIDMNFTCFDFIGTKFFTKIRTQGCRPDSNRYHWDKERVFQFPGHARRGSDGLYQLCPQRWNLQT